MNRKQNLSARAVGIPVRPSGPLIDADGGFSGN